MTVDDLFSLMAGGAEGRDLYISADYRSWYLTYGNGREIPLHVVAQALASGRLCRTYSGQPGCYSLGDQTIDRATWFAIPPKERRGKPPIYLPQCERDLTVAEASRRAAS